MTAGNVTAAAAAAAAASVEAWMAATADDLPEEASMAHSIAEKTERQAIRS